MTTLNMTKLSRMQTSVNLNAKWFSIPKPNHKARVRLFCFPYAGGHARTYYPWAENLNPDVELVSIQPPGRANRIGEKPFGNMHELVDDLFDNIQAKIDRPFVFLGHSLGCRMAYALTLKLLDNQLPAPQQFFASASGAPHIAWRQKQIYHFSDDAFIEELKTLDGTPEAVLNNKEVMALFLPALRADFKIADTYVSEKRQLPCPIFVIAGNQDHGITQEQLHAWKALTSNTSSFTYLDGDHFYIETQSHSVLHIVNSKLDGLLHGETLPNACEISQPDENK